MTTRNLAAFAAGLSYDHLPADTVETAKRLLLDGLGCLLAGTAGGPARSAADMVRRLGGASHATIFADNTRSSARNAAFVNGVTLYSVGLNDILDRACAHPGACVIPVLLAVGEWQRLPGTTLLAAMAAGYEVIDRIARTIMPSHRERGFHPTGTCGTFGAAAAAGRLLALDADEMACAFGIAGSQAAGLYEYIHDGTSTMMFHAGRAAQNGVEAALLTRAGLTGPATVLEGTRGFFHATADAVDPGAALLDLGQRYALDETSIRPYFGCTSTIAASGATAQLTRRTGPIRSEDVEQVRVYCHPVVAQDNAETNPRTLLAARLSLPFNVALVLARGDVLTGDLEEKDLSDVRICNLIPLVRLISDANVPRFGSTVQIHFKEGTVEEAAIHSWRGDSANPLSWDEVVAKFQRLIGPVITDTDQRKVIKIVAGIEAAGVKDLVNTLSAAVAMGRARGEKTGAPAAGRSSGRDASGT